MIDRAESMNIARSGRNRNTHRELPLMIRRFLVLYIMTCSAGLHAVEDNPGAWAVISASGGVQPGRSQNQWRYWLDAQHRAFDVGSGVTQSLVRPAIGLDLGPTVSVWAGYAYFTNRGSSGERVDEHRPWQQLSWAAHKNARGSLGLRLRLEQRFVESGDDAGWVFRTQVRYAHRLDEAGRWQAVAFIEPFIALNNTDWGSERDVAQNRIFAGGAYRITSALSIEFGYMNQHLRLAGEDLVNHLGVAHLKLRP